MAVLTAPATVDPGASVEPQSVASVVEELMPPGPPAILTRVVLAAPATDQLLNASGGYAL